MTEEDKKVDEEFKIVDSLEVEEGNEQDLLFLERAIEQYKANGLNEAEAQAAANLDLKQLKEKNAEVGANIWKQLVKETKADKLLKDQLDRALGIFKTEFEKARKPHTIDFKLRFGTKGAHYNKKGELLRIASATLTLEVAQDGLWEVWRQKVIDFRHVREMRDGHGWRLALCEAMFQDFVSFGLNYQLLLDGYRKGRITTSSDSGGVEASGTGEPRTDTSPLRKA